MMALPAPPVPITSARLPLKSKPVLRARGVEADAVEHVADPFRTFAAHDVDGADALRARRGLLDIGQRPHLVRHRDDIAVAVLRRFHALHHRIEVGRQHMQRNAQRIVAFGMKLSRLMPAGDFTCAMGSPRIRKERGGAIDVKCSWTVHCSLRGFRQFEPRRTRRLACGCGDRRRVSDAPA